MLQLSTGEYGFPNEIADDPLLHLILARSDDFDNAEERRLFYVVLTKARHRVYLLAEGGLPSLFAIELCWGKYNVKVFGRKPKKDVKCPDCKTGYLIMCQNSKSGKCFFDCSHYPYCEYSQPACPACGIGLVQQAGRVSKCKDCGEIVLRPECEIGWLHELEGPYGLFYGCSKFPGCHFSMNSRDYHNQLEDWQCELVYR